MSRKRLWLGLLLCVVILFGGHADVFAKSPSITVKQGYVYIYDTGDVENLTTFETLKTKPIKSWGKWNILWDGWSIDAGFSYDNSDVLNTGAVMLGRNFGTIGKYLPIDFPLKDYISITLYPAGAYINDLFDSPKVSFCSGIALIKAEIRF